MNIKDAHLDALKTLGYTEDEARFLYIAATHSGYFTVSQYLSFAGIASGKRSYKFTNKVFSNRHANRALTRRMPVSSISFPERFTHGSARRTSATGATMSSSS